MPETRVEKSLFVLGVLAIAALGFLVAHLWHHTHGAAAPASSSSSVLTRTSSGTGSTGSAVTTAARMSSTTVAQNTAPTTTRGTTSPSPTARAVSLLLTARLDTWLEVRSGSSAGSILYSGTLAAGSTKAFRAKSLWARFGAAGNLSAQLDRKPFHLPSGTYDATFDGHGFRKLGA